MTEPTQAQIEAAANAIVVDVCLPEGRDAWKIAKAALTAAAQVENRSWQELHQEQVKVIRAAAIEQCADKVEAWFKEKGMSGAGANLVTKLRVEG